MAYCNSLHQTLCLKNIFLVHIFLVHVFFVNLRNDFHLLEKAELTKWVAPGSREHNNETCTNTGIGAETRLTLNSPADDLLTRVFESCYVGFQKIHTSHFRLENNNFSIFNNCLADRYYCS